MTLVRPSPRGPVSLAVLGLLAAGGAAAQPVEGFYVGAGAGLNLLEDAHVWVDAVSGRALGNGVQADVPAKIGWGAGYGLTGAVGYGVGNGVRLELEGSYRSNDQSHSSSGGGTGGRQTQFGVMGNVLFDVDVGADWVYPYVGLGAGYQASSWRRTALTVSGVDYGGFPTDVLANQTLSGLAWQVIAGAAFPVAYVPGLSVTVEYRYLNMAASRRYRASASTPFISTTQPDNTTRVRAGDDSNHSLLFGLRYAFNTPEVAPIPRPPLAAEAGMPLPAPVRTYLVFFDWNSAELPARGRAIVEEAVRNAARVEHTRIEVAGHADRSGAAQANQTLSLRRAQAVAAELQRQGVPLQMIELHGYGDSRPLVPTEAGIREPQNRRVEIVYR